MYEHWGHDSACGVPFFQEIFQCHQFSQNFWILHLKATATLNQKLRIRTHTEGKPRCSHTLCQDRFYQFMNLSWDSNSKFFSSVTIPRNKLNGSSNYMWLADSGSSYVIFSAATSEGLIKPDTSMTAFHLYIITWMISPVPTFSQINFTIVQHLPANCYQ
jgi:hypothetical protein